MQLHAHITSEQATLIDALAKQNRCSRAAATRAVIDRGLAVVEKELATVRKERDDFAGAVAKAALATGRVTLR